MRILAIDPGNEESAWLEYSDGHPWWWAKELNKTVRRRIEQSPADQLHVEMIASYGMPVGAEVFETCVAIGRFLEVWKRTSVNRHRLGYSLVFRREVKLHLCNSARAKDANVRQALIDRYGGRDVAIGRKANPGPLYGISGDCWAALAVAVTVAESTVAER